MNKIKTLVKDLERRGIFSKKPKPIYPFLLGFISLFLWHIMPSNNLLKNLTIGLTIFTFIFAVLHWFVVRILES
ncbi:MAG TPA: hypothetical protein QGG70_02445 [Candidatus Pacearchaeota archaeon]|mgnify:CR=1 FL=1|jgi:hypothetical protein|nr:hypothetical protein [Candidatus Pacearchaeota archaeon]|tara:strand:+ start:735 stop:956 length:222 start_codon:yes stop_codon:yes gene_type:complete